jgi:hypothetical protein
MIKLVRYDAVAVILLSAVISMTAYGQPAPQQIGDRNQLARDEFAPPGERIVDAPGGMSPGSDPFMLIENSRQVQVDLGLSADQIRRLGDSGQLFRTQIAELAHGTNPSSRADMERHKWTSRGAIARILTPEQLRRLQEIMLQIEGPCLTVSDQRLGQDLGLSGEQVERMRSACQQLSRDMGQAFQMPESRGDRCVMLRANRERIERVRMEGQTRVLALLSGHQRRTLQSMAGRELALEPVMPPECHH